LSYLNPLANSNQARVFPVAHQWANILTDEFANQGTMEDELGIPTCLFGGPPTPGDIIKLGESQQGFMDVFARPLFEGVARVLPSMTFSVDELERNKQIWENRIAQEKSRSTCSCGNSKSCSCSSSRASHSMSKSINDKSRHNTKSSSTSSSSNGQVNVSPASITATVLPLQQIAENLAPSATDASSRGCTTINGSEGPEALTSQSDSRLVQKSTGPTNEKQRAVSAHDPPRQRKDQTGSLPNGLNPGFAASETDVRFLGNGGSGLHETVKTGKKNLYLHENGDDTVSSERNGRRDRSLTQSFKRLWRKRWRPGANTSSTRSNASSNPDTRQSGGIPVESRHGPG
jgi:3'5'-cyclic nucleotide phosphodiesterase